MRHDQGVRAPKGRQKRRRTMGFRRPSGAQMNSKYTYAIQPRAEASSSPTSHWWENERKILLIRELCHLEFSDTMRMNTLIGSGETLRNKRYVEFIIKLSINNLI